MTDRRAQLKNAKQNSSNSVSDALILPHTNRPKRLLSKEPKGADAENTKDLLRIVPKDTEEDAALNTLCPMTDKEQLEIVQSYTLLQQGVNTDQVTPPATVESAVEYGFDGKPEDLERYLRIYGPNELPKAEPPSYFCLWINSFKDIMMILLLIAMVILFAVGDPIAATAILVILMIATNIGAYVEYSSNQAAAELGDLPGQSLIKMKKEWVKISNVKLLPGLIVQLQTGDIVPADCVLLETKRESSCTEAMLTGESEPVAKHELVPPDVVEEDDPHVLQKKQENTRLYMGTEFTGEAMALIVETGERTQMGQIFQSMVDADPELSDLQKMIDKLILVLALLSIAASVLNAAVCIPTGRGVEPNSDENQALTCVLNSVALTVAAVPENLPVALVIALASIIKNLANIGVIVKSLPAGEELSRLNYVFSDKTGTLTEGVMTARATLCSKDGHVPMQSDFHGPKESPELSSENAVRLSNQIRLLAAKAQDELRSNPTGDACKKALPENLDESFERVLLEPASSKTKMARIAMTIQDQNYLVKVGSDWVLDAASRQATLDTNLADFKNETTEEFDREACLDSINTWAKGGYRVICVAAKPVNTLPEEIEDGVVGEFGEGFTFLGCLVIQDPPREDVKENIKIIRGAGVVVTMITGDNPITGLSIAQQVGLAGELSDEERNMCLINAFELFHGMEEEDCKREIITRLQYSMRNSKGLIIGRVSPFQKRLFVECARAMGLVVAMTGDGANDAPALKMANVGIAMGNGSDIAKAAGDMILVNPSFSGIVEAIRAGRLGFDNILKFLLFLLGTNISEVLIYLTQTFADIVITLDALNLLVLNLLTDGFPAIALSVERAEGDLMKREPLARNTSVLNSFTYTSMTVTNLALMGSYLTVILLGNLWYLGDLRGKDTTLVDNYDEGLKKVRMMFILLINISQLLLGFTHRAPDRSVFSIGFFSGKWMNYASLSSIGIIIFMTHVPGLKDVMGTTYPDWFAYLLVIAMSFLPMIMHEVVKVLVFQKNNYNVYSLYRYEYKEKDQDTILKLTDLVDEEGDEENGSAAKKSEEESV